jgi:hypothetical protein
MALHGMVLDVGLRAGKLRTRRVTQYRRNKWAPLYLYEAQSWLIRPLLSVGAKDAESGGKLRSYRRPFHLQDQFLRTLTAGVAQIITSMPFCKSVRQVEKCLWARPRSHQRSVTLIWQLAKGRFSRPVQSNCDATTLRPIERPSHVYCKYLLWHRAAKRRHPGH